jgi:hypothetical protein
MPRARTVELNKHASQGDAGAALALLEQSMARGHGRIALLRYLQARSVGASLERRHHDYARRIAGAMSEGALTALFAQAQHRHCATAAAVEKGARSQHDGAPVVDEHPALEKCLHGARERHAFDVAPDRQ